MTEPKPATYLLGPDANPSVEGIQPYAMVVVKAGSAESAGDYVNTIFAQPPVAGQTVWADSNGSSLNRADGPDAGDKGISHVIICAGTTAPPPAKGAVSAEKKWVITGLDPNTAPGFTPGTPGTLTFNEDVKPWTNNTTQYNVGTDVTVTEAGDGTPPKATDFRCTIDTAATTYTVGDKTSTTPPTVKVVKDTTVNVTITNTANCTKVTPPVVTPPVVTPPVVTPPAVTPPFVTPPVVDEVEDETAVGSEEDVVEEESAVAGSEDELADTGGNTTAALLGALLVLGGAALIGSRRRFGMND